MEDRCQYQLWGGPCRGTIVPDESSYTGWRHTDKGAFQHFATPTPHPFGDQADQFLQCAECGKLPDENPEHFLIKGHAYRTQIEVAA